MSRKEGFSKGGFSDFPKSYEIDGFQSVFLLNGALIEATGLRLGGFILFYAGNTMAGTKLPPEAQEIETWHKRSAGRRSGRFLLSWASVGNLVPPIVFSAKNEYEFPESQSCGFDKSPIQKEYALETVKFMGFEPISWTPMRASPTQAINVNYV